MLSPAGRNLGGDRHMLAMTDEGGIGMDLRRSPITDFIFAAPSLLLYGLGRAFCYVLSGE